MEISDFNGEWFFWELPDCTTIFVALIVALKLIRAGLSVE
jgi:hypothetical protein